MDSHAIDDQLVLPLLAEQLAIGATDTSGYDDPSGLVYFSAPDLDLDHYDRVILCMSGGKDSIAALLRIIEMGADMDAIELWHHDVDGREGSTLMDWPFMADYNRKLALAFGVPLYFSWLNG